MATDYNKRMSSESKAKQGLSFAESRMSKATANRLITPDLEKAMKDYPLYSQDSKKKDALCIAVFFIGNARWYILEGQRENDDFVLFGISVGLAETEYGYISANEMASVALDASKYGLGTIKVE